MKKDGGNWKATLRTFSSSEMGAVKFISGALKDKNNGQGYFIRLYDLNGNETLQSEAGCIMCAFYWGYQSPSDYIDFYKRDKEKIKEEFNAFFNAHPEFKKDYPLEYLIMNAKTIAEKKIESPAEELSEFEKNDNLSENEYILIKNAYSKYNMPEKAKEITEKIKMKYPKGNSVCWEIIDSLKKEKDFEKQFEIVKEKIKYFEETKIQTSLASGIFTLIVKKAPPEFIEKYILYMLNEGLIPYDKCGNYLDVLISKKSNLELALKLANLSMDKWRSLYKYPVPEQNSVWTEDAFLLNVTNEYINSLIRHAAVLSLMNRKEEGLKGYEEIFVLRPLDKLTLFAQEIYFRCLSDDKQYKIAVPIIEGLYKTEKVTGSLKELLKEIYIKKTGSEEEYNKYIKKLVKDIKLAGIESKKAAPEFTLMDLNGKQASLSDFKGKFVVLDFWATWCGWCIKSFPQMQKAVEKYKDRDVVFLFIDTMEKDSGSKDRAEKIITLNNYTFRVLLDPENKVSGLYGVASLPTKIFVDKDGNIGVVSHGYNTRIVEEIDETIELMR